MSRFLGMPIEGELYRSGRQKANQLSEQEVTELVLAVINYPEVRAIGWNQYTPYFNDGEPCVFRTGEPIISLHGITADEATEDYTDLTEPDEEENDRYWVTTWDEGFKRLIGNDRKKWEGDWPDRTWSYEVAIEDQPNPDLFKAFKALEEAMESGACDDAFLALFGDHANVVVDKENSKVVVEYYEHD